MKEQLKREEVEILKQVREFGKRRFCQLILVEITDVGR